MLMNPSHGHTEEIIQVCRTVVTASQMQSLHVGGTTSLNLQEAAVQQQDSLVMSVYDIKL